MNLFHLMSLPNNYQFESHHTEMGISKPLVILRLQPSHSLSVPLCMMNNIMHLTANLSDLMITLWCSEITCMSTDDINTWDWAVLHDDHVWQAHGCAIEDAGQHLPGSFDTKPCNITVKSNSDYKTWEYTIYMFALAPGLLHDILPKCYWINLCKLVRGFQILSQHEIAHDQVLQATVLLAA